MDAGTQITERRAQTKQNKTKCETRRHSATDGQKSEQPPFPRLEGGWQGIGAW